MQHYYHYLLCSSLTTWASTISSWLLTADAVWSFSTLLSTHSPTCTFQTTFPISSIPSQLITLSRHLSYPIISLSSLPKVTLIIGSRSAVGGIATAWCVVAGWLCPIRFITLLTRMLWITQSLIYTFVSWRLFCLLSSTILLDRKLTTSYSPYAFYWAIAISHHFQLLLSYYSSLTFLAHLCEVYCRNNVSPLLL